MEPLLNITFRGKIRHFGSSAPPAPWHFSQELQKVVSNAAVDEYS